MLMDHLTVGLRLWLWRGVMGLAWLLGGAWLVVEVPALRLAVLLARGADAAEFAWLVARADAAFLAKRRADAALARAGFKRMPHTGKHWLCKPW